VIVDEALGAERIGGKGSSLVEMRAAGLPVPPFGCIETTAFDDLLATMPEELRARLASPPAEFGSLAELSREAEEHLRANGLPAAAAAALDGLAGSLLRPGGLVAVRSSAAGEDSSRSSFAGQFETFLYVPAEGVAARVLDCYASAFGPSALTYLRVRGLGLEALRMSVVIQQMVDAAAAGVVFTADPEDGSTDRVLITAGFGAGQGVVDGRSDVDTYRLDADARMVEREVKDKRSTVVRDPDRPGETVLAELSAGEGSRPVLSDAQAELVARQALAAAAWRGAPVDVEWALDRDGELFLLQARPITAAAAGREVVFDNSNLVESYPGVTSPLTFSLMRRAYELNFLGLVRGFGAPRRMVAANRDVYPNLVARLQGRMYYNLSNWYRMFLQVPGMERALPAFESAMGFQASEDLGPSRSLAARLAWLPLQAFFVVRLVFVWLLIPRRVRGFLATFARVKAESDAADLDSLGAAELLDSLERRRELLFREMAVSPVSDFFTQQVYGLLGYLIGRWELGDPVALRNDLLCGERGMESVEPVRSLVRIAERARRDPRALALLEGEGAAPEVWRAIHEEPELGWLQEDLARHLAAYGDRSLSELKLEATSLTEEPSALASMLRNYLRGGQDVEAMEAKEQATRRAAEREVRRRLRFRPLRRPIFAWVLRKCRRGLATRENIRLTRGRISGLFRRGYRALGARFAEQELLARPEDVFFLTVDEVADAVRGASVTQDLRGLVELRRGEYEAQLARPAPSRIEARGIAQAARIPRPAPAGTRPGAKLEGVGCSTGVARGPALIVHEPRADLSIDGEVLVASTTDPGWVFLMVAAGGLVTEKGNVLSHTAIIGRELGIPTVVGVPDAMNAIEDGAVVELDGRAGTVVVESTSGESRTL
jgi:pyruvate,water dikinase